MARPSAKAKMETFTFRLDARMKAALNRTAAEDHMRPAELVRSLVDAHIQGRARRRFEREARRQCLAINAAAHIVGCDESQVGSELEADLESFADEWR